MLTGMLLAFFAFHQSAGLRWFKSGAAAPAAPGLKGAYDERGSFPGFPIDINTATVEELMLLPGIGEKTAQRIVEERAAAGGAGGAGGPGGGFKSVDDLLNVRWIGQKKLDQIRHLVTVNPPPYEGEPEKDTPEAGSGDPPPDR